MRLEKKREKWRFHGLIGDSWETNFIRFGKAGAHPQLALGIAIAPETVYFITTSSLQKAIAILFSIFLDFNVSSCNLC
jgi:hypothetical protein